MVSVYKPVTVTSVTDLNFPSKTIVSLLHKSNSLSVNLQIVIMMIKGEKAADEGNSQYDERPQNYERDVEIKSPTKLNVVR